MSFLLWAPKVRRLDLDQGNLDSRGRFAGIAKAMLGHLPEKSSNMAEFLSCFCLPRRSAGGLVTAHEPEPD
jgi:hypothetical protein